MTLFGYFFGLGGQEILVLLVVGVLLFGKKLPEIGRYLGKGIVEFKKGVQGLEDQIDTSAQPRRDAPAEPARPPQRITSQAPKFDETTN